MSTDIEITSNALLLIGDNPITAWNDNSAGETVSEDFYTRTKNEVLCHYPWSFAMKSAQLVANVAVPDPEENYTKTFDVPNDLLRLWYVKPEKTNFKRVGQLYYTNATELLGGYVHSGVLEANFPDYFTVALEYKLASKFAKSITEDTPTAKDMFDLYLHHVARASSIDAQSQPQEPIHSRPFIDERLNGFSPYWSL
jgi:hypothetical protein